MRGLAFKFMIACALLALTALAVQFAVADNGGDGSEIEIKAPLEAVDCASVPPTITVLGLNIDIGTATIEQGEDDEDGAGGALTCAGLTVGQVVEVELASDLPNATTGLLAALKVDAEGEECDDDDCVKIEGPLQAADPTGQTITILGLVIDTSTAEIGGDEDGEEDGGGLPPAPTILVAGQFVEVKLASNQPPLTATEVEVKNSGTGIEVEIVDQNGNPIDDGEDDVVVQGTLKRAPVKTAAGVAAKSSKTGGKKVVTFLARGKGHMRLKGLPPGSVKLVVTRVHNSRKSSGKSSTTIQPQVTTHVVTLLKGAK